MRIRRIVIFVAICALLAFRATSGPPLEPWHTSHLSEDFTARDAAEIRTFDDYLALEERLFEQLRDEVYAETQTGPDFAIWRYSSGSAADPRTRQPDFNRSFELPADNPRGGVLLLHGMSDSPYSLRELGESLHARGYQVIGLRLPGHGTAPSGLRWVRWQDMAAAVQLSTMHLAAQVGDKPVHVVGYSTGASLAINMTLDSLDDDRLTTPASLVLVSPAIGVTRLAALASVKAAIGRIPGLGRLAWTEIVPEFDPYKYNSFTANAGAQVHELTRRVSRRISELVDSGRGDHMPPILTFKSTVDATVSTSAVIDRLLKPLPVNGNELVLFDINRNAVNSVLIIADPGPLTNRLTADASLPFAVTLIGNRDAHSSAIVARHKPPFSSSFDNAESLGLEWPRAVLSLSHVALPISPGDPLYGEVPPEDKSALYLGQIAIRGERGLMRISSDWLLRLRYNPFYTVLETRVFEWLEQDFGKPGLATVK